MATFEETGKIWFSGKFVDWKDATIHVCAHVIHYGSGVFEGLRCYDTPKGSVIYRLEDHIRRLFDSAKMYRMPIPFSQEEVNQACIDTIKINNQRDAYIRPIAFRGYHSLGVDPRQCIMVGDRIDKDVIPAKQVGMRTILIRTGLHKNQQPRIPFEVPDAELDSVLGLAEAILKVTE